MKKIYHTWYDVECQTQEILRQIVTHDSWRPDYVVGITRGGLMPAMLISQYLECPMHTLKVSLRDGAEQESNLWMAEDAYGHRDFDPMTSHDGRKNILIVDDINDSGATLNWIQKDWKSSCFPKDARWKQIWGSNVRVACLYDNESSASKLDVMYSAISINKSADPAWIVFPWESWWQK
jgi:hypoxanthine phosphoribosyltransferase